MSYEHDDYYDLYDVDVRPASQRPGQYYERPAKALTSHEQLKPGTPVWHVYLWEIDPTPEYVEVHRVGTLADLGGRDWDDADSYWWNDYPPNANRSPRSCRDASLDGCDYNNNYIFASEADALEAIANRVPRKVAANV